MEKHISFYQFEIKKSKFLAYVYEITSDKEVEKILEQLKIKHKKSKHICWAYQINDKSQLKIKYSDDKEPKGTAGLPILNLIQRNNLNNIVIFVVRYFGGVKLGSSNLYRSYIKVASECIKLINI